MPREDVPYPMSSQICSIRERIAELQNEINGLLATINSVGGDGQKDIKLLSDNAALSITSDPVQHEIHLDLDTSQLPAADVNSVNGQTGTVVLDGDDLDGVTPGNSVNDDISALQTADGILQNNINAEALARQNADSTLQNNINAALATIPGEVSSQIAADATINGLVAADAQNVKLTGAQTINGIKTFTANPKAANAASGATDTSVVNANWISQTGDSSPNNVVHRSGNETIGGSKVFSNQISGTSIVKLCEYSGSIATTSYRLICKIARTFSYFRNTIILKEYGRANPGYGMNMIIVGLHSTNADDIAAFKMTGNTDSLTYRLTSDNDYVYLYRRNNSNGAIGANSVICIMESETQNTTIPPFVTANEDTATPSGTLIKEITI